MSWSILSNFCRGSLRSFQQQVHVSPQMWSLHCCVWSPCSSSWSSQVEMWGLLLSLHLSLCAPVQPRSLCPHFYHVFKLWIFSSHVYSFTEPTWRVLDLGYHTFFSYQIPSWFLCHISISFLGCLNSSPVSSPSAGTWWPFSTNPLSDLCQTISTVPS